MRNAINQLKDTMDSVAESMRNGKPQPGLVLINVIAEAILIESHMRSNEAAIIASHVTIEINPEQYEKYETELRALAVSMGKVIGCSFNEFALYYSHETALTVTANAVARTASLSL